jgi:hypothetical protein
MATLTHLQPELRKAGIMKQAAGAALRTERNTTAARPASASEDFHAATPK